MKITSAAAAAILWMGAAIAQAPDSPPVGGGPGGGPGPFRHESSAQRMDRLATLLDLTDEQKAQVQTILDEQHAKMKAQREAAQASGQRPTFEQMKAVRDQLHQETLAKLTPVLTPAQLKKFELLMEERGPPGGPH
ncbi:MAG: Spy/CpxP family protein refolding chaperone [Steroidobacteraceae bacterium]